MNTFTKDELIKLKNGLEYLPNSVSISQKYWHECEEIIRKIQSMIDHYCDHKNIRSPSNPICTDCGMSYE